MNEIEAKIELFERRLASDGILIECCSPELIPSIKDRMEYDRSQLEMLKRYQKAKLNANLLREYLTCPTK
ncbi:MAG: hypothetical protein EOM24_04720 [Chloroflexia bacterium]|nr:hypothetical protein [Chloroflexia bacterium]